MARLEWRMPKDPETKKGRRGGEADVRTMAPPSPSRSRNNGEGDAEARVVSNSKEKAEGESRLEWRMQKGERRETKRKRSGGEKAPLVRTAAPSASSSRHSSSAPSISNQIQTTHEAECVDGPTHDECNDVTFSGPSSSSSLVSRKHPEMTDWMAEVIKEAEFCFSNTNLPTEHRFMKFIKNAEGSVPLTVLANFYNIRKLQKNPDLVAAALRNSKTLVVSEDGHKVRRLHPFPITDLEEIQSRIVVAENLPDDHSMESMQKLFGTVGSVKTLRVCEPEEPGRANLCRCKFLQKHMVVSSKLHAFVEYESVEQAKRAVSNLTDSMSWRSGMLVRSLLRTSERAKVKSIRTKHPKEKSAAPSLPSMLGDMEELMANIVRQVEFSFSDRNLPTEHRLMKYIKTKPGGLVPISIVSRLLERDLQNDPAFVADALRCSKELVVSGDGQKVGRLYPFPLIDLEEIQSRIVVAENLPHDHSIESMQKLFGSVGNVKTIRICEPAAHYVGSNYGCRFSREHMVISNKLHAFVEYESVEQANKAVSESIDSNISSNSLLVRLLLKTPPLPKNLKAEIIKQVEFCFSDKNLPTELRLMKYTKTKLGGVVPISIVSRLLERNLQKDPAVVVDALRCSNELVVSRDGQKVRRLCPFRLMDLEEIQSRIVVAENLPNNHCIESMEKLFGSVGNVKMIRVCERGAHNLGSNYNRKFLLKHMVLSDKLHAFVEYESVEQANRAVSELTESRNGNNGLLVQLLLKMPLLPEDLRAEIIKQAEFCFSDRNLAIDLCLMKYIMENSEVPISLVTRFLGLKGLENKPAVVAAALQSSKELVLSEGGYKVRRLQPLSLTELEEIQSRIVVAENIPYGYPTEDLETLFGTVGNAKMLHVRKTETPNVLKKQCDQTFLQAYVLSNKPHIHVEYKSAEQAKQASLELSNRQILGRGLHAHLFLKRV